MIFVDNVQRADMHLSMIIEKVINNYNGYFKSISIEYVKDDQYELNKIFYAVIKVSFKDFIQSEIFKLTMINSTSNVSD